MENKGRWPKVGNLWTSALGSSRSRARLRSGHKERMLQARAPGVSQGQVGRFHLVLGLPRVQQLKLAPEELVVSVQWVWHLFHFLLLTRGCLQGLGQLDVR